MSKRILVIDHSRTIQTLLSIHFRNAGHQVLVRPTTQDALRVLAVLPDAPDLIFLAIHTHEQDDYKVIQYVKEHGTYADTELVVMVLQEEKARVQQTLRGTKARYLLKPFHIQDALALVSTPSLGVPFPLDHAP